MRKVIINILSNCTLTLLTVAPLIGCAQLALQHGSYIHYVSDPLHPSNPVKVHRLYNSRSLHVGHFGFGWCSNMEYRLLLLENGEIQVEHCNQKLSATDIKIENRSYHVTLINQTQLIFGPNRKILQLKSKNNPMIRFTYDARGRLTAAHPLSGPGVRFHYTPHSPFISKVIDTQGLSVLFTYRGQNLTYTKSSAGETFYRYDALNNLTSVHSPLGQTKITYDAEKDQAFEVKDYLGCTFKLQIQEHSAGHHTELSDSCQKSKARYSFNQQGLLQRIRVQHQEFLIPQDLNLQKVSARMSELGVSPILVFKPLILPTTLL